MNPVDLFARTARAGIKLGITGATTSVGLATRLMRETAERLQRAGGATPQPTSTAPSRPTAGAGAATSDAGPRAGGGGAVAPDDAAGRIERAGPDEAAEKRRRAAEERRRRRAAQVGTEPTASEDGHEGGTDGRSAAVIDLDAPRTAEDAGEAAADDQVPTGEAEHLRRPESHVRELADRPLAEIRERLDALSTDELRLLLDYEQRGRNRKTVLKAVEATLTAGASST